MAIAQTATENQSATTITKGNQQTEPFHDSWQATLGKREYFFILALALGQALLLYLLVYAERNDWSLFRVFSGHVPWLTIVLAVPSVLMLSIRQLNSSKFWRYALLLVLGFGITASFAAYLASAEIMLPAGPVLGPFAFVMAACAFVITPFVQLQLTEPKFRTEFAQRYTILFESAWHNALTLLIALIFVGLGWMLLTLWGQLFGLIGIRFFTNLFTADPMAFALTGLLVGLGILIGRSQSKPIQTMRKIIFALFTGLLPVLSLVILMFLLALPFGGFGTLWNPGEGGVRFVSVAALLGVMIATQLLFFNAVFQHGEDSIAVYPRVLRYLVRLSMLALPIFACIALAAVWVRIGEYGITPTRYWALLAVLVLAMHSIGYGWSALRKGSDGFALIPKVNVFMAGVVVVLGSVSHLPITNPYTLSAASQARGVVQLMQSTTHANEFTEMPLDLAQQPPDDRRQQLISKQLEWLRFEAGRPGVKALHQLQSNTDISAEHAQLVAVELDKTHRYRWQQPREGVPETAAELVALINHPISQAPPPIAIAALILQDQIAGNGCDGYWATCYGSAFDFSEDTAGYAFCQQFSSRTQVSCSIFIRDRLEAEGIIEQSNDGWRLLSQFTSTNVESVLNAMQQGNIALREPCWPILDFAGSRHAIHDTNCE